jgi:hypothetical protein
MAPPFWTLDGRGDQLVILRCLGWTPAAIAAYFGTTRNAIIGYLDRVRRSQLPTAPPDHDPHPPPTLAERLRWDVVMAGGCRWVIGEPGPNGAKGGEWRWCAAPLRVAGEPYCREHFEASRR